MQTCDTRQCKNIKKCHALHGYAVRKCCLYVADGRQRSSSEHLRLKHDCNLKMKSEANNQLQKGRFKKLKPNERLRPEAPDVRGYTVCIKRHRKSEARPTEEKTDYDREKEIEAFQARAVELFVEPYDDRIEPSEDAPSVREV